MRILLNLAGVSILSMMGGCSYFFPPQYVNSEKYYPDRNNYHNYYTKQQQTPQYYPAQQRLGFTPIRINYELLNTVEDPVAFNIGDVTFVLRGRVDAPLSYSFVSQNEPDRGLIGNQEIRAEAQLSNRITIGAVYGGQFQDIRGRRNSFNDNFAVFAGGSWGTVFGGNVSDLVFEQTRRKRGATSVPLAGDGPLGGLSEWSGGYLGRYGPIQISTVVDDNAGYDIGIAYQRPWGPRDYRITARHSQGTFTAADGITELDSAAISLVGEYVYGSSRFDIGSGYEHIDNSDRWYASAGFSHKRGPWSLSAEGHYGQIEDQEESSAVLGIRRDLARGLSTTLAFDYENRQIAINGLNFMNVDDRRVEAGLSYEF